jgi:hypothetical protein
MCLDLIQNGTARTAMLLEYQALEALQDIQRAFAPRARRRSSGDVV